MGDILIRPVETKADRDAFLCLPWRVYEGDPNWTAPLLIEAVGAWQGALAGMRGPTCVVQAMPPRTRAVHV